MRGKRAAGERQDGRWRSSRRNRMEQLKLGLARTGQYSVVGALGRERETQPADCDGAPPKEPCAALVARRRRGYARARPGLARSRPGSARSPAVDSHPQGAEAQVRPGAAAVRAPGLPALGAGEEHRWTPTAQRAREPRVFLVEARALRDDATLEGALLWREWRVEADTEDTSSSPTLRRVERETEVTTVRAPSAATGPRREARLATCSLFFVVAADATLWASLLPRREHSHAAAARRREGGAAELTTLARSSCAAVTMRTTQSFYRRRPRLASARGGSVRGPGRERSRACRTAAERRREAERRGAAEVVHRCSPAARSPGQR
eukprot:CAMPEP_0185187100 /NCGR_PEP_ID=MMETSP1140-20130426/4508_1 /TAXON_ID=298111 /ORGANISM="Pavlova sp., Strain CCMP459" /LENGTH=322 /DNA_ID=CAMNT_0027753453 /DNA_START=227 /DNA_END=1194 /DNA_ORIENTATION=-